MDVGRWRDGLRSSVVAGSVWESRMKSDEVKGGIKVFNGEDNSEETSSNNGAAGTPRTRLRRGQAGATGARAVSTGKRKTWKSDTIEGSEKNPIQIAKGKAESLKNSDEQGKELSVSVDGIKKSPIQVRRPRSEGSKEIGVVSDKTERSPVGIRKPRPELLKSSSDLGKDGGEASEGIEKNSAQLRKVKSESSGVSEGSKEIGAVSDKTERSPVGIRKPKPELLKSSSDLGKAGGEASEGIERNSAQVRKVKSESSGVSGNAIQLSKSKSESNKALDDEFDKRIDKSVEVIEKSPVEVIEKSPVEIGNTGSDENCKEFGVCQEMVISGSVSNVDELKSAPKPLVDDGGDQGGDEEDDGDEFEEEVDEEIEVDEVEKKSLDIKEINAPVEEKLTKVVNEKKVVNEVKKLHFGRREVKKLHQVHQRPEPISLNVKKQSPVIRRATVHSNVPKYTSSSNECHSSFPETHSTLQSLVDLIMWKDISRSVFVFGIGTFIILSSSYTKDINISFITVISYLGLVYLAAIFLFKSIICRGAIEIDNVSYVVGEEEAMWLLKLVLPYLNEFLLKLKALFSGDPATTIKLAVLLFVLARCGSSITIWTMAKVGFFGVFTVPKVCSLYSTQITVYAKFWVRRFRDAWDSCTHKKALTVAIFLLVWNLSSVVARIWAAFILVVAFRYYQQKMVTDDWVEMEDDIAPPEDTWHVPTQPDLTKQKKGF